SSRDSVTDVQAEIKTIDNEARKLRSKLDPLLKQLRALEVSEFQRDGLSRHFNSFDEDRTLDNLDELAGKVDRALVREEKEVIEARTKLANSIERRFADFQRRWRMDAGDLDTTLASASEFFAKLKRLETDRLPDYEQRFFDLLRNQSHQNLAALSKHMSE